MNSGTKKAKFIIQSHTNSNVSIINFAENLASAINQTQGDTYIEIYSEDDIAKIADADPLCTSTGNVFAFGDGTVFCKSAAEVTSESRIFSLCDLDGSSRSRKSADKFKKLMRRFPFLKSYFYDLFKS